jgi:3',5'-cyclic-nucleotide phosphodiesterase
VAASAHDVGHPGTTNSFEVRHKSAIAIQYHNRSVLENFHASLTFQTMLRTPGNLLDELGSEDATRFYNLVVNIILETDLAHHADQIKHLREFDWEALQPQQQQPGHLDQLTATQTKTNTEVVSNSDETDAKLEMLCCGLVHVADISCVTKPWDVYEQWIDLLFEEFYLQVMNDA